MVHSLLDAGVPLRARAAGGAELRRHGDDLAGLRLVADGDAVYACHDDGQILDALKHGQLALFVAVDRFAADVEAEVATSTPTVSRSSTSCAPPTRHRLGLIPLVPLADLVASAARAARGVAGPASAS